MSTSGNPLRAGHFALENVLNIAHRGARAFAPENTLSAFKKAEMFGCHMFELDVHMSRDNILVVHHDDDLIRCTDAQIKFPHRASYFVSDFTYEELLTLDAGRWYVDQLNLPALQRQPFLQTLSDQEKDHFISSEDMASYASGETRLPTLGQALGLAQGTKMMVNIEIKTMPRMYAGIAKAVVEQVTAMDMTHCVLISSFDHEQLAEVRQFSTALPLGVLSSDRLARPGDYLQLLDADAYNPGCYSDYDSLGFGSVSGHLDMRGIQHVRAAGLGVNVWTCNDKDHMRELIEAGVTGLFSDYPNRVRDVCSQRRVSPLPAP